jgi:phosphotransferase system IIB component
MIVSVSTPDVKDTEEFSKEIVKLVRNRLIRPKQATDTPAMAVSRVVCLCAYMAKYALCTVEDLSLFLEHLRYCSPLVIHHTGMPSFSLAIYNKLLTNVCQFVHSVLKRSEADNEATKLSLQMQQLLWKHAISQTIDSGSTLSRQFSIDLLAFMFGIFANQNKTQDWMDFIKNMIESMASNLFQNLEPQECDQIIWQESVRPILSRFTPHIPCDSGDLYDMINSWRKSMDDSEEGSNNISDTWVCRCAILPSNLVQSLSKDFTEENMKTVTTHCATKLRYLIEKSSELVAPYSITLGHYLKYKSLDPLAAKKLIGCLAREELPKLSVFSMISFIETASLAIPYVKLDDKNISNLLSVVHTDLWNVRENSTAIRIALIEFVGKLPLTTTLLKNGDMLKQVNDLLHDMLQPPESSCALSWTRQQKGIEFAYALSKTIFPDIELKFPSEEVETMLQDYTERTSSSQSSDASFATKDGTVELFSQKRKRQFTSFVNQQRTKIRLVTEDELNGNSMLQSNLQKAKRVRLLLQQIQQTIGKEDPSQIREIIPIVKQAMTVGESIVAKQQRK